MAKKKIQYVDKVKNNGTSANGIFTNDDANEIKNVVNNNADLLHEHNNKQVIDSITTENIEDWNEAQLKSHSHTNKPILDNINQELNTGASPTFLNVFANDSLNAPLGNIMAVNADYVNADVEVNTPVVNADYVNASEEVNSPLGNIDTIRTTEISSESFVSGFSGTGFRLNKDGNDNFNLEVDNLRVRKEMDVYQLTINEIKATNGSIWVSDGVETYEVEADGNEYLCRIDSADGSIAVPFRLNDIVRCQKFNGKDVKYYTALVTNTSNDSFILRVIEGGGIPSAKDKIVRIGNTTDLNRQGALYLTSSDSGAPFMDVIDGVNSASFAGKTKVRLGQLDGIVDSDLGSLSGYGIYAQNGYFKGKFIAVAGSNVYTINEVDNEIGIIKTENSTSFQVLEDKIEGKVSEDVFNSLNERVATNESELQIQSNEIALKVSQSQVDTTVNNAVNNLTVGGRNLIPKTKEFDFLKNYHNASYSFNTDMLTPSGEVDKTLFIVYNGDLSNYFRIEDVVKEPNTEYTFSCWIGRSGYGTLPYSVVYGDSIFIDLYVSEWQKIEFTFTSLADVSVYDFIQIQSRHGDTNGVWIYQPKLEKGNKATDWTPAPEDIDDKINSVSTRVTNAESSITQQANEIALRATKTEVTNQVSTAKSEAISTASTDATTKSNTAQTNAVTESKTYTDSQILITNDAISLKSDKSVTDGLNTRLSSAELKITPEAIQQTVKSQTETIANTTVNNIKLGSRNLILNSDTILNRSGYHLTYIDFSEEIKSGETYTMTVWATSPNPDSYVGLWDSNGSAGAHPLYKISEGVFRGTFTVSSWTSNRKEGSIYQLPYSNDNPYTITKMKLEVGNKATDWTPAPEDVNRKIDAVTTRVTNAESSITQNANQIALKVSQSQVDTTVNSAVKNLKIGSRNLLRLSNTTEAVVMYGASGNITFVPNNTLLSGGYINIANIVRTDSPTYVWYIPVANTALVNREGWTTDTEITISFKMRANTNLQILMDKPSQIWNTMDVTTVWKDFEVTIKDAHTGNYHFRLEGDISSLDIADIQIEKGNKATAWSPAPEDIDDKINSVTTRVTNAESSITQQASEIALKVTQSQVDSTVGGAIGNIKIGGTNTYSNKKTTLSTFRGSIQFRNTDDCKNGFHIVGGSEVGEGNLRLHNTITSNGWWTVSGYVRGNQDVSVGFAIDICDLGRSEVKRTNADNQFVYFEHSVNVTNYSSDVYNFVDFENLGWAYYLFKDIKVEKGNKATAWSPAPEDIDETFKEVNTRITNTESAITQTANSINLSVTSQINDTKAFLAKGKYDGTFENGLEYWSMYSPLHVDYNNRNPSIGQIHSGLGSSGGNVWRVNSDSWIYAFHPQPIRGNEVFRVRLKYAIRERSATGASLLYAGFSQYYADGTTPPNVGIHYFVSSGANINDEPLNEWIVKEGIYRIGMGESYAGVVYYKPLMGFNYSGGNAVIDVDSMTVEDITNEYKARDYTNSQVTILNDAISLKASQNTVSDLTTRVSSAEAKITPDAIRLTATGRQDTRSDNQPPSWYYTNYRLQTINEFKFRDVIGLPYVGEDYAQVTTNVPWQDASGGDVIQEARQGEYLYTRHGNTNTWSPWVEKESTTGAQNKANTAYNNSVSYTNSQITVLDDKISLRATKEEVNNLQIGGRNYFKKSTAIVESDGATGLSRDGYDFSVIGVYSNNATIRLSNVITGNGWWTVSFEHRIVYAGYPLYVDICDVQSIVTAPQTSEWQKVTLTVNVTNYGDGSIYNFVDISGLTAQTHYFRNVKVEKGQKATDWSPAPEDIETRLNNAELLITPTAINATVKEQITSTVNDAVLASLWSSGKSLRNDPTFLEGFNGISVYNNMGNGAVQLARLTRESFAEKIPTTSTHALYCYNVAGQSTAPGFGGFHFSTPTRANAKFLVRMIIAFDSNVRITFHSNQYGDGSVERWLTPREGKGTDNFGEYIHYLECGKTGTFSATHYFAFEPTVAGVTTFTARIAFAGVYDITDAVDSVSKSQLLSSFTMDTNGINLLGKRIDMTGKVTFSSLDSTAQATISTAVDQSTNALNTANTAILKSSIVSVGNSHKKILNPVGFSNDSGTGAILINTPIESPFMFTMKITGYIYVSTNKTDIDLSVTGYAYTPTELHNYNYTSYGSYTPKIYIARDVNGKLVIQLGEVSTAWSYPKLVVEYCTVGHALAPDSYKDGWSMVQTASLPSFLVKVEPLGTRVNETINSWTYANTTEINGAKIKTGSITADKIMVDTLDLNKLRTGATGTNNRVTTIGIQPLDYTDPTSDFNKFNKDGLRQYHSNGKISMYMGEVNNFTFPYGSGNRTVNGWAIITFKNATNSPVYFVLDNVNAGGIAYAGLVDTITYNEMQSFRYVSALSSSATDSQLGSALSWNNGICGTYQWEMYQVYVGIATSATPNNQMWARNVSNQGTTFVTNNNGTTPVNNGWYYLGNSLTGYIESADDMSATITFSFDLDYINNGVITETRNITKSGFYVDGNYPNNMPNSCPSGSHFILVN